MISRYIAILAVVTVAGCTEDVPTLVVMTGAYQSVELAPGPDFIPQGIGHYRWQVVEKPPNADVSTPTDDGPSITIVPPRRGTYVYDRWFVDDASEQLSCHVVVDVSGSPPVPMISGPSMVVVGAMATYDGSMSASREGLPVTFQWRLALRPGSSTAALTDATNPTLTFVPDVAGDYGIELRVFDGELWSPPATATLQAR